MKNFRKFKLSIRSRSMYTEINAKIQLQQKFNFFNFRSSTSSQILEAKSDFSWECQLLVCQNSSPCSCYCFAIGMKNQLDSQITLNSFSTTHKQRKVELEQLHNDIKKAKVRIFRRNIENRPIFIYLKSLRRKELKISPHKTLFIMWLCPFIAISLP